MLTAQQKSDLRSRVLAGERITDIAMCKEIVESLRGARCSAATASAEKKASGGSGGKRKKAMTTEALLSDFDAFLPKGETK